MDKKSAKISVSRQFMHLLHVQVGVLIAPFIFIAALTGLLYALTPQIEQAIYQQQLFVEPHAMQSSRPLSEQVMAAQKVLPHDAHIFAVRPAPTPNSTTRVLYIDKQHPDISTAIFVNPYNLMIRGQLPVYGTSGVLPIRTFLDNLHRNLLFGTYGRAYSELAASWLGVFTITGLIQWYRKRRQHAQQKTLLKWHSWIGLVFLPMLLFFSATGLTWSNWAGANIAKLRHLANSDTPSLNTQLHSMSMNMANMDAHAEHHMNMDMSQHMPLQPRQFDQIMQIARKQGLSSDYLQIKPSYSPDKAWTIEEMRHKWPVQIDALAVDMQQQKVVDAIHFKDFPLSAKLTRWGVDAHIGVLFGWLNQFVLVLSGLGIVILIMIAYGSWLRHAKVKTTLQQSHFLWTSVWQKATLSQKTLGCLLVVALYFLVPVWVISIFCLQMLSWAAAKTRSS